MKKIIPLLLLFFIYSANLFSELKITFPSITIQNTDATITIKNLSDTIYNGIIFINETPYKTRIKPNSEKKLNLKITSKTKTITVKTKLRTIAQKKIHPIPLWLSIIPPLIAIILALLFKEVFSAIFLGIFTGTSIIAIYKYGNIFLGLLYGFLDIPKYLTDVLTDSDHISIIIFSMLIGGTVNIVSKNGGMKSIINKLSRKANNRKSAQLITVIMGIIIFFDDYANTLVVGNTMRPLTDKLKISREKLSYIVDSTAAPVVAIAFITTWIGAELSYIKSGLDILQLNESPYIVFLHSLKYAFYPVFTIIFILLLVKMGRDFGPMYHAEKKAIESKVIKNDSSSQDIKGTSSWLAIIPIGIIIFGTLTGLIYTGYSQEIWNSHLSFWMKISETLGRADSFVSLIWASLLALITAIFLSVGKKIFPLAKAMEYSIEGFKSMLQAIIILTLAWSLALLTQQMHTADFFTSIFKFFSIPVFLVPSITFLISALISFSTGSSWGTMAILYPIMLPVSWYLAKDANLDYSYAFHIFYGVAAAIITGSVFGDHCSPISDTTILSSMASGCRHIDHVNTQMPYAITVATVSLFIGILPTSLNIPFWLMYILGIFALYLVVKIFGKKL
jgi:Na+/H+ antiporter NhaC